MNRDARRNDGPIFRCLKVKPDRSVAHSPGSGHRRRQFRRVGPGLVEADAHVGLAGDNGDNAPSDRHRVVGVALVVAAEQRGIGGGPGWMGPRWGETKREELSVPAIHLGVVRCDVGGE